MDNSRNKNLIACHCNEFLNSDPSDRLQIIIPAAPDRAQLEHLVDQHREGFNRFTSCGSDSGSKCRTFRSDCFQMPIETSIHRY